MSVRFDLSAIGSHRITTVPELPESSGLDTANTRYIKGKTLRYNNICNDRKIMVDTIIPIYRKTGGQIISSLDKPVSPLMTTLQDKTRFVPLIKPSLV